MNKLNYPANKKNIWFSNLVKPIIDKINEIIDKVKDDSGGGIVNITNTDSNLIITNTKNNVNINLNFPTTLNNIIKFSNTYPYNPYAPYTELKIGNSNNITITDDAYNDTRIVTIGFPNDSRQGYIRIYNSGAEGVELYFKASHSINFEFDEYNTSFYTTDFEKLRGFLDNYLNDSSIGFSSLADIQNAGRINFYKSNDRPGIYIIANRQLSLAVDDNYIFLDATMIRKLNEILNNYTLQNP
jgi:hypothetical protein